MVEEYFKHNTYQIVVEVANHKPDSELGNTVQRTVNSDRVFGGRRGALVRAVMENQRCMAEYHAQVGKLMKELSGD